MIELRWVWHDHKNGPPPNGAIEVDDGCGRLFQKLQYRYMRTTTSGGTLGIPNGWSDWIDVPHDGLETP